MKHLLKVTPQCFTRVRLRLSPVQISVHLKDGQGADGLAALKNKPQLHSLVAKQLCQNISGKNTIIFTGPSITSLSLFSEFSKQGRQRRKITLLPLPRPSSPVLIFLFDAQIGIFL